MEKYEKPVAEVLWLAPNAILMESIGGIETPTLPGEIKPPGENETPDW